MDENKNLGLPENAQRELKPGEKYVPLLDAQKKHSEVTLYSVLMGLLMVVIFSAAAAYLGKVRYVVVQQGCVVEEFH